MSSTLGSESLFRHQMQVGYLGMAKTEKTREGAEIPIPETE
jgi:hypothetical protein